MIHQHTICRACQGKRLSQILDLGEMPLANDFVEPGKPGAGKFPLQLMLCETCSLVQLGHVVSPEVLYSNYNYVTSTSATMRNHLDAQFKMLLSELTTKEPKVLEIASNTGEYLKRFQKAGCSVLGVEPAANIAMLANNDKVGTKCMMFTEETSFYIANSFGKADLIIARHVFAHIDDWADFVNGLKRVMHRDTLAVIEVPYVMDFFARCEFDSIYHEHLSYVSITAVNRLLSGGSGLKITRVDRCNIHGGSILIHLRREDFECEIHQTVETALHVEKCSGISKLSRWNGFVEQFRVIRRTLPAFLAGLKASGNRIIGYGAAAKGNTLLNACGIGTDHLDGIIDNTPFKQGKVAPGSRIPILPPEKLLENQPDHALILAWNFEEEIVFREREYQRRGGRFISSTPNPKIIPFVDSLPKAGVLTGSK